MNDPEYVRGRMTGCLMLAIKALEESHIELDLAEPAAVDLVHGQLHAWLSEAFGDRYCRRCRGVLREKDSCFLDDPKCGGFNQKRDNTIIGARE